MKNKTYQKYLELCGGKIWTEMQIRSFRSYLAKLAQEDRENLLAAFSGPYSITLEQTLKGYKYLLNKCFKKNGGIRKNCPFKKKQLDILKTFKGFEFVGLRDISINSYFHTSPIYKVIGETDSFEYAAGSFGEIEVIMLDTKFHPYVNNPKKCIERDDALELAEKGKINHIETFIGGMVDGRGGRIYGEEVKEGHPEDIFNELSNDKDLIFVLEDQGQFQTYFSVYEVVV
jgi:hypothetical protein